MRKTRSRGFTLVELLVVIAIIAVLTGLTAVFLPKALKKGAQTKMVGGMRQMASSYQMYAKDHGGRLPAVITPAEESEERRETYWFYYLEQLNSEKELGEYFKNAWWKETKTSIYLNPMQPKKLITAKSTGYAMNAALPYNIAVGRGEKMEMEDAKFIGVNLNAIPNPVATPIVMPHWSFSYVGDAKEMGDKRFEPFLSSGRMPVLFLDSHVETLLPKEYSNKGLNREPKSEESEEEN